MILKLTHLSFNSPKNPTSKATEEKSLARFFLGSKRSVSCFAFPCVSFFSRPVLFWLTVCLFSAFMSQKYGMRNSPLIIFEEQTTIYFHVATASTIRACLNKRKLYRKSHEQDSGRMIFRLPFGRNAEKGGENMKIENIIGLFFLMFVLILLVDALLGTYSPCEHVLVG
jgi:hypothetical protein